jgi:RimJ/RimL family protein N-acetyltransferase
MKTGGPASSMQRVMDTADLHLRPLRETDAKALFAMLADAQTVRYWSSEPATDPEAVRDKHLEDMQSDAQGSSVNWAICKKGSEKMLGKCVLFNLNTRHRRAEIGFLLDRRYWRRGLMRQALEAVLGYAFSHLGLHRIEADVDPANSGSLALLEKLGFRREGLFRDRWFIGGQWKDSVMLSVVKKE